MKIKFLQNIIDKIRKKNNYIPFYNKSNNYINFKKKNIYKNQNKVIYDYISKKKKKIII